MSNILTQNSVSPDALQAHVKSAVFNIEQIQNLLRYLNQQSQDVLQRITTEAPSLENFNQHQTVVRNQNHDDENFGLGKVGYI